MTVVSTITSPRFHKGTAALLNSLVHVGFQGEAAVGHVGPEPAWADEARTALAAHGIVLAFEPLENGIIPNYLKPFLLQRLLATRAAERFFYFDSDVVVLEDWPFFERWVENGVALCSDLSEPDMAANHPLRGEWAAMLHELGRRPVERSGYVNSGFLGFRRDQHDLVDLWAELVDRIARYRGGYHVPPDRREPGFRLVDQDVFNAALMGVDIPLSVVGREGMGFTGGWGLMAHAIGGRKPWERGFTWRLLRRGQRVPVSARIYSAHSRAPIAAESRLAHTRTWLDMLVARVLGRVIGTHG